MAYTCPKSLDGFMPFLTKADVKFRQQVGSDLLAFLAEPANPITCQDIGQFIDSLIPWMQNSNYKVSSNGIEVITYLVDRLGHDFRPYLQTVLPVVLDRLGDARDTVREKAHLLILKLLERTVLTPQALFEKLSPGLSHKNAKIREEVLRCFVNTLNEHGAQTVTISKFIPDITALLSDQSVTVRDTAFATLVDLYKHVGEKLRRDLQKRKNIPPNRLQTLLSRFDEVREAGELLPTASTNTDLIADEVDRAIMQKPVSSAKKPVLGSAIKRPAAAIRSAGGTNSAGAIDEHTFVKSFEDVPTVQIYSPREISEELKNIVQTISDLNKDWNKRIDALKRIRSLVVAGAVDFEEFRENVRTLEVPLQGSIKDLRSQVVREACVTIAFLAQSLGSKFDRPAELLLPTLINLIQNSAKIIATAGHLTVRYVLQYIHNPRLIPIITTNSATSKSKEIRKTCCEFLEQILSQWPTHPLERHVSLLQEAIKKGIADADPEARLTSRRAFRGFREHFPDQAEVLLQSLEPTYRKALQGELCLSSSSSSGSIAQAVGYKTARPYKAPTAPHSAAGSTENLSTLQRAPSLPRSYRQRSGIPVLSRENSAAKGRRSNSAIDLQAAQRAKVRAQYAAMARHKIASGTCSLQGEVAQRARPRKSIDNTQSPERTGRTRNRGNGVSQSQPTSRSGSPSSRLAYMYNRSTEHDSPRPRRLSSGIPRSTTGSREASRETSPSRDSSLSRFRSRGMSDRPPLSPASRPVMAQRILQQSREAESALEDALAYDHTDTSLDHSRFNSPRRGMRSLENHSDDSETSSVCSERSFDSYRRDSYSWSGSQQRLSSRDMWEPCRDINEIIALCASTAWQERKDGLNSLKYYLNSGTVLTQNELRHLTEIFTRMFMDSHTKSLGYFIETLNELIKHYKNDLHDWLYVLLQRIFLKLGTDLLSSTHSNLLNTLEIIKKSFPITLQMRCVHRFLVDGTQTPTTKVKILVLNYITSLCNIAEPNQLNSKPPAHQALQKIIMFIQDQKSVDLRNAAKNCLVALWNCNTPLITMMLAELPQEQEEIARSVVHMHMRKNSVSSEPGSPLLGGSPKAMSPTSPKHDDINQEEIYRSLRKTTAEIQNYSYEALGPNFHRNRDTTSQDSGISQMSVGNDVKNDVVSNNTNGKIHHHESINISGINGINESDIGQYGTADDEEIMKQCLENCVIDNPTSIPEKLRLLTEVKNMIQKDRIAHIIPNFRKLLRILIDNLSVKDVAIQSVILDTLTEIFKRKELEQCWCNFVELLTLRVLNAHCEENKDVVKKAEKCAAAMASVFPFHTVLNILVPLIQTGLYPSLQGVIKTLTKIIEFHPDEVTDDDLKNIMPGLIKTNEHSETSVRKNTVMCMVALHKAVGEERLFPYISTLPGSKLKLLRLYISRAQQEATGGSKNSTS